MRLALATCVFVPFLRRVPARHLLRLLLIGGIQFGAMYICYNGSFVYLQSYEVALFTVFTPVYVTLLHDAQQRKLSWHALWATLLATVGAAVVLWPRGSILSSVCGFLLVQGANVCFAVGQLAYRAWAREADRPDDCAVMGWLFLGGMLVTLPYSMLAVPAWSVALTKWQMAAIVYLGVMASGVGFFLWNAGARRTSAAVLAVCNNLKIPLAAVVSLLVFGGKADPMPLLVGVVLFAAATWIVSRKLECQNSKQTRKQ